MKISTHLHTFNPPLQKEHKALIMRQCVSNFQRHEVDSLEELYELVSKNVVYAPIYWKRNYRKIDNAMLKSVDLLIYDSDDGQTDEELVELLSDYNALVLETASWSEEKEKYRIFLPLKRKIRFDSPEEYTAFYRFVGDKLGLHYDKSTTECGRGYIGLNGKPGFIISGKHIDFSKAWKNEKVRFQKRMERQRARTFLRSQERKEMMENAGYTIPTPFELYQNDKKFNELALECRPGNNYRPVFKLLGYCKFRGLSAAEAAVAVSLLKLGNEYENLEELQKRFNKLK